MRKTVDRQEGGKCTLTSTTKNSVKDRKRTFIKNLEHGGKLYEVINAAGYRYYIIVDQKGREWLSTMDEYESMVNNWNINYGFTKGDL